MPITANLGRIADCGQFFVYRLSEWDGGKWRRKQPWGDGHVTSPSDPSGWTSYSAAAARVATMTSSDSVAWAVGLWITADLNVFFLDIDRLAADYQLDDEATCLLQKFPGCMVEWSSSRRGLHIVGSHNGGLRHIKRNGRLELYTADRGIALSTDATGTIDTNHHDALQELIDAQFRAPVVRLQGQPAPVATGGPDMAALSLALRQADKIMAAPDGERNHTLNTAAYTLGGMVGAGRMSRDQARSTLMSAVERAGWGNMELQAAKIEQALDSGVDEPIAPAESFTADTPLTMVGLIDDFMREVNTVGTFRELMETVVPKITQAAIPHNMIGGLANCVNSRLDFFNARMPIADLRALLAPRRAPDTPEAPLWVQRHCYVKRNDKFLNVTTGVEVSARAFDAEYNRMMPQLPNGKRESASEWATDRWSIRTVDDVDYRPDQPVYFTYEGIEYVNKFSPDSFPVVAEPTADCSAAIQAFCNHLYLLSGQREHVYFSLLKWLAHNVQNPGHKIRWSPVIKGVQGDGKSMVGDLMFAVMGSRNVKMTSNATLSNSGNFTDWATGAAVNFIEEIRLSGKQKHDLFNAMKIFISDTRCEINRKGRVSSGAVVNYTNHWANTNYSDALPIEPKDNRRWMVVFSPYSNIQEAVSAKGFSNVAELVGHFKWMGDAMRREPGAWRQWLLGIDLSDFAPDARAPDTDEAGIMARASEDDLEQVVIDIIERGGLGIHRDAFSAMRVGKAVELELGYTPRGRAWNAILSRLGYIQFGPMYMDGKTHRIWTKNNVDLDEIKRLLITDG